LSPRILLLSAYHAQSHAVWAERLQALFPDWYWNCLCLPPRHFNWRIRSNGLHWAYAERDTLEQHWDLLIATSMVDLASLRSLVPSLCSIPSVVYFHENQFAYPDNETADARENIEPKLVPVYSALSADRIIFNSDFNRDTFLEGVRNLSKRLPEPLPEGALKKLENSGVLAVPLLPADSGDRDDDMVGMVEAGVLDVVWNHRWEYDKNPALLLAIVQQCLKDTPAVRFHIVGQQFRQRPSEFEEIARILDEWGESQGKPAGVRGYLEDVAYRRLLHSADVVLSTALHDFQGLAVQEASVAGCSPLAPDDLVYPEYLGREFLYAANGSAEEVADDVVRRLQGLLARKANGEKLPVPDLTRYEAKAVKLEYARLFSELGVG
jgi:glycosyltransferase involved in cell wall biosynthesis